GAPAPAVALPSRAPVAVPALPAAAALGGLTGRGPAALGLPSLAHRAKRDPAADLVDRLDLDLQGVAHLHGFLHAGEALAPAELRDVDEPVLRGRHLDERTEVGGADHGPLEPLAHRGHPRVNDLLDHPQRFLGALALPRADEHRAVVLDVDVGAGDGDDLVDPLALRPDDLADLVHRD